ncbi:Nitrogen assimilation transcription factor nit-4 [Fusarium oxysporum f. sp. albedinis]|nr:Nitrogen assimilation transcription factor nit-4 [Fusarium oxysporum f. sp. albedinis]
MPLIPNGQRPDVVCVPPLNTSEISSTNNLPMQVMCGLTRPATVFTRVKETAPKHMITCLVSACLGIRCTEYHSILAGIGWLILK